MVSRRGASVPRPLIRSAKPLKDWQTFAAFDDAIFRSFLLS